MRENRPYGSEGGEAKSLPYPYRVDGFRQAGPTTQSRAGAGG
jgi:hypothetical protein